MAAKDPNVVAQKWANNLSAATQAIESGVQNVTQSPGKSANAKKDTFKARLLQAIDNGSWEKGNNSYSLQDWQSAMTQKGIPRIAAGAQTALPKMQNFLSQLLPYAAQVSATVKAMPNANESQRDARALKAIQMMRAFKQQRR